MAKSDDGSVVGEKVPRRGWEGGPIMRGFKAMMMRLDIILSAMELTGGFRAGHGCDLAYIFKGSFSLLIRGEYLWEGSGGEV